MPFLRLYPAFAAGYLLSYFYRNVNAVISPDLTRELSLSPGALGLLTAVYFVAFAGMQLPAGMLLDRYGPRRVEPVLLLIAAAGALLFAFSDSEGGLVAARALIGMGVAICLMAPLKAIATWYPKERQASLGGWMMVAGSAGALVATAPLEFALRFVSWRVTFVALAATTCAAALLIGWFVPDTPAASRTVGLRAQWRGVRSVFAHPRFWWIAPLAALGIGSFMALQGLWAVPWLIEVNGFDRAVAAQHLLVMGVTMLVGYVALGLGSTRLARRGMHPRHLFAAGFALSALALTAIIALLPGTWLWWALYGLGATVNVLAFTVLNDGFAIELTGRANTALNLAMFIGSFAAQWGIGIVVDLARSGLGLEIAGGLKLAFAIALGLYALGYGWFAWGWRRHGGRAAAAV
jgi:predicted MFS family arabinose efflux permease